MFQGPCFKQMKLYFPLGSLCILNGALSAKREPSKNSRFPCLDLRTEISRGQEMKEGRPYDSSQGALPHKRAHVLCLESGQILVGSGKKYSSAYVFTSWYHFLGVLGLLARLSHMSFHGLTSGQSTLRFALPDEVRLASLPFLAFVSFPLFVCREKYVFV